MKTVFTEIVVLAGVSLSLVFAGCPTDEDSGSPAGAPLETPETLTVGGFEVTWNASSGDGSAFEKPREGQVTIFPGTYMGPSNLGSATMALSSSALDSEAMFFALAHMPASATAKNINDKIQSQYDSTDRPSNLYLYIQSAKWYKITIGLVEAETALPAGEFQIEEYISVAEAGSGIAKLKSGTDFKEAKWYAVSGDAEKVIRAIYEPNKPNAAEDIVEDGKNAVAFTPALSKEILGLFTVMPGNNSPKVKISGTALPAAKTYGADANNLVVIDAGIPGEQYDSSLPAFYIPYQGLGNENGNYAHIRLRVNSGASLVIEANNSGYIASGAGNSCANGYFTGGCVEVMAGGKLRDSAYEGFPLGTEAVLLNRYGSYLSVGPEPGSADATAESVSGAYTAYYSGYLVGPAAWTTASDEPRIEWDAPGNTASSFLEVRPGKIATDARLTVKKFVGLIYSVWFVGNAKVTVDNGATLAANESAGGTDFNFYANTDGAVVDIKSGGVFDRRFLRPGPEAVGPDSFIPGPLSVKGVKTGTPAEYSTGTGITGILVPEPAPSGPSS
ncbi:MAG: hypothetical protein LBL31_04300 [Spirochaetaceae bacterium]|jgi:hypothetical protein|nr:hypothetical protein [Spirochaetaceae bacterium]